MAAHHMVRGQGGGKTYCVKDFLQPKMEKKVDTVGKSYSEGMELVYKSCLTPGKGPYTMPPWAHPRDKKELYKE